MKAIARNMLQKEKQWKWKCSANRERNWSNNPSDSLLQFVCDVFFLLLSSILHVIPCLFLFLPFCAVFFLLSDSTFLGGACLSNCLIRFVEHLSLSRSNLWIDVRKVVDIENCNIYVNIQLAYTLPYVNLSETNATADGMRSETFWKTIGQSVILLVNSVHTAPLCFASHTYLCGKCRQLFDEITHVRRFFRYYFICNAMLQKFIHKFMRKILHEQTDNGRITTKLTPTTSGERASTRETEDNKRIEKKKSEECVPVVSDQMRRDWTPTCTMKMYGFHGWQFRGNSWKINLLAQRFAIIGIYGHFSKCCCCPWYWLLISLFLLLVVLLLFVIT